MARLPELIGQMRECRSQQQLTGVLLDRIPPLLGADTLGLFLFGPSGMTIEQRGANDRSVDEYLAVTKEIPDPLFAAVTANMSATHIGKIMTDKAWRAHELFRHCVRPSSERYMGGPLVVGARLVGALSFGSPRSRKALTDSDVAFWNAVCLQASALMSSFGLETEKESLMSRLSPRECEIVKLVAKGFTNIEIGEALAISVNTVKKAMLSIFRKCDVSKRAELIAALGISF